MDPKNGDPWAWVIVIGAILAAALFCVATLYGVFDRPSAPPPAASAAERP